MASTRIWGPAVHDDDDLFDDPLTADRHLRPHVHHRPGNGIEPEPEWTRLRVRHQLNYDALLEVLKESEGFIPYMYLCTAGRVTVGIGNMLPDLAAAQQIAFSNTSKNQPASEQEIAAAFHAVAAMPPALRARDYKQTPSLEITEQLARELAIARLDREFIPAIERIFPDFGMYPEPAQKFIVDMAYNGGAGYFRKRQMVDPITRRDWLACIPLLPQRDTPSTKPDARRIWREDMLRQAAADDGT